MRTHFDRVRQLHMRAEQIRQQDYKRKTAGLGSLCVGIFAMLLLCMILASSPLQNTMNIEVQGSSLLSESAGGYVLAAVVAFFAGVIITAVIFRYRKK